MSNLKSIRYTHFVHADIGDFLQATSNRYLYDTFLLDPPKLAPSVKPLDKSRRKFHLRKDEYGSQSGMAEKIVKTVWPRCLFIC